jgi:hypothetical protein
MISSVVLLVPIYKIISDFILLRPRAGKEEKKYRNNKTANEILLSLFLPHVRNSPRRIYTTFIKTKRIVWSTNQRTRAMLKPHLLTEKSNREGKHRQSSSTKTFQVLLFSFWHDVFKKQNIIFQQREVEKNI